MKFGKRLQEEIVPQWADFYVNYKRLKQFIHHTELTRGAFRDELFNLISEEIGKAEGLMEELLDDLQKTHNELLEQGPDMPPLHPTRKGRFFRKRLNRSVDEVTDDSVGLSTGSDRMPASDEDASVTANGCLSLVKRFFLFVIGDSQVQKAADNTPRAQFIAWYSNAHQLQHFAELNLEAIHKTAKKLRKWRSTEGDLNPSIEAQLSRSRLTTLMPRLRTLIADVCADYERKFKEPLDPYANVTLSQAWHAKWHYVFLAIALFSVTMYIPHSSQNAPAHNCAALFVLVIVLWITEAIPFFCTAMLIPIVAVPLSIVIDPATHKPATPPVASEIMLGKMFNHIQILVMGGLTIGKALAKTNLEMYAASALHSLTAHRPSLYLLGVMLISCTLCAFVSNVAAPLLVLGVIQRVLWQFPEGTRAPHGILLGLAFACNIGGILSPIASPQNAVAMATLSFHNVTFASWVAVALPVAIVSLLFAWAIVLLVWRPFEDVPYIPLQVVDVHVDRETSSADRCIVLSVSIITVALWVFSGSFPIFGDTGIVALIPIVVFFGIGILSKDDFNTLSWHLMFLLAGGNMLGLCAHDSRMLDIIASSLKDTLMVQPPYGILVALIAVVACITTFVSHTVAAIILLPMIAKIGFLLPHSKGPMAVTPELLVMLCALMCSGAMAFPISSFPNVNSLLAEDEKGRPYLKAKDFLFCGCIVTLFFALCLVTWMVPITNIAL